ncbi:lipase family protein [Pseudomonas sp. NPDC098747]|uniref:lipase family protein n=1 Tax=Pseudomonas sp. NPDC098747 TaxID=3364487 RepID=UPI00383A15EA
MSLPPLSEQDKASLRGDIHTCPLKGHWVSFQLVDEFGDGTPYAGLSYEFTDYDHIVYTGTLDANGYAKRDDQYCGPVVLKLNQPYEGHEKTYTFLRERPHYPLPITELQVRAEKTRFALKSGTRTKANPAQANADIYYQVEVSQFVEHSAHLPPMVRSDFEANATVLELMPQRPAPNPATPGSRKKAPKPFGIGLMPNKHHVLEVRPLRALRPMISTDNAFCALNQYQLALMATLSYAVFGQDPNKQPVEAQHVTFPHQPSVGNWFGASLAAFDELWQVDATQTKAYYPLYEEVPYSRRLEIAPFDPVLYPEVNDPSLEDKQENPANIHFLDHVGGKGSTDTQVFITHHDELVLISVRGTAGWGDIVRDANAEQVPFDEGDGHVHNGFYGSAKAAYDFAVRYLEKFYSGQKLVITGHSLGGAVALIVSEWLRRNPRQYDIILYTYGAPRAGDAEFVKGASALTHHRTVNHNDPVPSVPAPWMDTSTPTLVAGAVMTFVDVPTGMGLFGVGLKNFKGPDYEHHGKLRHFMPVVFADKHRSSILWEPGCDTVAQHAICTEAQKLIKDMPVRDHFLTQVGNAGNHSMVGSYIPCCWASLRRWNEAHRTKGFKITSREYDWVHGALGRIQKQLQDVENNQAASPDKRVQSHSAQAERQARQQEIGRLKTDLTRLEGLRYQTVSDEEVFGDFAGTPELLEAWSRWETHAENNTMEQLAMIPPEVVDDEQMIASIVGGHVIGAPYEFDIDSVT